MQGRHWQSRNFLIGCLYCLSSARCLLTSSTFLSCAPQVHTKLAGTAPQRDRWCTADELFDMSELFSHFGRESFVPNALLSSQEAPSARFLADSGHGVLSRCLCSWQESVVPPVCISSSSAHCTGSEPQIEPADPSKGLSEEEVKPAPLPPLLLPRLLRLPLLPSLLLP